MNLCLICVLLAVLLPPTLAKVSKCYKINYRNHTHREEIEIQCGEPRDESCMVVDLGKNQWGFEPGVYGHGCHSQSEPKCGPPTEKDMKRDRSLVFARKLCYCFQDLCRELDSNGSQKRVVLSKLLVIGVVVLVVNGWA